jgi:hypothetical protein
MSWEMQQLVKAGLRLVEVNFLFFVNFSVLLLRCRGRTN